MLYIKEFHNKRYTQKSSTKNAIHKRVPQQTLYTKEFHNKRYTQKSSHAGHSLSAPELDSTSVEGGG